MTVKGNDRREAHDGFSPRVIARRFLAKLLSVRDGIRERSPATFAELARVLMRIGLSLSLTVVFLGMCDFVAGFVDKNAAGSYQIAIESLFYLMLIDIILLIVVTIAKSRSPKTKISRMPERVRKEKQVARALLEEMTGEPARSFLTLSLEVMVTDCCRLLASMSLGRETPSIKKYMADALDARLSGEWDAFIEEMTSLARKCRELGQIWQSSFEGILDIEKIRELRGDSERLSELAENNGVNAKIEAYYSGVPVQDIVAG